MAKTTAPSKAATTKAPAAKAPESRAQMIPFGEACEQLKIKRRTGYNQVSSGTFPLEVVKRGPNSFVRASDLKKHIASATSKRALSEVKGRPSNIQKAAIAAA